MHNSQLSQREAAAGARRVPFKADALDAFPDTLNGLQRIVAKQLRRVTQSREARSARKFDLSARMGCL